MTYTEAELDTLEIYDGSARSDERVTSLAKTHVGWEAVCAHCGNTFMPADADDLDHLDCDALCMSDRNGDEHADDCAFTNSTTFAPCNCSGR